MPPEWVPPIVRFPISDCHHHFPGSGLLEPGAACMSDWQGARLLWSLSKAVMGIVSIQTQRALLEIEQGFWKMIPFKWKHCLFLPNEYLSVVHIPSGKFSYRNSSRRYQTSSRALHSLARVPRVDYLCPHWWWAPRCLTSLGHSKCRMQTLNTLCPWSSQWLLALLCTKQLWPLMVTIGVVVGGEGAATQQRATAASSHPCCIWSQEQHQRDESKSAYQEEKESAVSL